MKRLREVWDKLSEQWANKQILLLLDYDGTLTPIALQPSQAILSQENRELLEFLVKNPRFQVAILSGRKLSDLKEMVGIEGIIYIGNHGWEIEGSHIHFESLLPLQVSSSMHQIKYELITQLCGIPGVFVEDKGITLSVHYRLAAQAQEFLVKRIFDHISMPFRRKNEITAQMGKKVLELRPSGAWDKGNAAIWLLRKQEIIHGQGEVLPIYIGDDSTDADAFEALSHKGITIFVGSPKPSAARYYLENPQAVTEFLQHMTQSICEKL